jgi:hypothetical protein
MKIIILLFALIFGFGATCKKTANDLKEISVQHELNAAYKQYPNMLPVVNVIAPRI